MNWIEYDVARPEDGQVVAICTQDGVGSGKYDATFSNFIHILMPGNAAFRQYRITHWLPLPEGQKES
ncbi:hypothetical protein PRCB_10880 [Pantoea rodasii]|uniref:DUF551 domain-containing protein n=1 Tax=Pantoea rodasii TaxID=1076549 RepID=A0A2M9WDF8_9GAMM|nr:hypothetical protein [Pantoea rodasii]ORM61532.1 hypothetical protein HA45_20535 [Pantoea rodasii]PJZ05539.1 hypothetical protein PRCB_10880 [Pantoea rodasii]